VIIYTQYYFVGIWLVNDFVLRKITNLNCVTLCVISSRLILSCLVQMSSSRSQPVWKTWQIFLNFKFFIWSMKIHKFNFPFDYSISMTIISFSHWNFNKIIEIWTDRCYESRGSEIPAKFCVLSYQHHISKSLSLRWFVSASNSVKCWALKLLPIYSDNIAASGVLLWNTFLLLLLISSYLLSNILWTTNWNGAIKLNLIFSPLTYSTRRVKIILTICFQKSVSQYSPVEQLGVKRISQ